LIFLFWINKILLPRNSSK